MTARSDYMLSQKYADRVKVYYEAENQAIQKWNELNDDPAGEQVSYQIPINDSQQLAVTLSYSQTEKCYQATSWKTENIGEWTADDTLNLYPGN